MSSDVTIRPATQKDAVQFYDGRRPPFSFRGYVAEKDGVVIGVGGVYYQDGIPVAFSDMKPAMRRHKKVMAKACRILLSLFDQIGGPVYAVACSTEPTAPYLLAKLGFRPTGVFGPQGETLVRI